MNIAVSFELIFDLYPSRQDKKKNVFTILRKISHPGLESDLITNCYLNQYFYLLKEKIDFQNDPSEKKKWWGVHGEGEGGQHPPKR